MLILKSNLISILILEELKTKTDYIQKVALKNKTKKTKNKASMVLMWLMKINLKNYADFHKDGK